MPVSNLSDIRLLDKQELTTQIIALNQPKFRAHQIYHWLWAKKVLSFDEMKNIPKPFIEILKSNFTINSLRIAVTQISTDGTIKIGFETYDNRTIEGVIIPTESRMTACISSQVGCTLSCKFCATGTLKRARNLLAYEIYDQAYILNQLCIKHYDRPLSNIVYMGMGEPLLNYDEVIKSIRQIMDLEDGLGMGAKRITISTSGIVRNITKLMEEGLKINLALSLHAPNDNIRNELMEINKSNPIDKLMDVLELYYMKTNNKITFEYILLSGVNDSVEQANQLALLCQRFPVYVNLIEYNIVETTPFYKSKNVHRDAFLATLRQNKVEAKVRVSRGKDIDAACGQLVNKMKRN